MPRICVLCGKPQSQSFSVFSFPSSIEQRNNWVKILLEAKPNLAKDKIFVSNKRLKNGVCEMHFLPSEISKGKKCRLSREAVPSINIWNLNKSQSIINSYKPLFMMQEPCAIDNDFMSKVKDGEYVSDTLECKREAILPECTIQIEIEDLAPSRVQKSMVDNIFVEKESGVCLCCGIHNSFKDLSSVLKVKIAPCNLLLVEELANVFGVPKERIVGFSTYVCRKCLKIIEDMLELRKSFLSLRSYLKNLFLVTNTGLELCDKTDACFEINGDKNSSISEKYNKISSVENEAQPKRKRASGKERKFFCDECPEEFESLATLSLHIPSHEKDPSNSQPHSRTKSNLRPRQRSCSTCEQSFLTKEALRTHMKSHRETLECPQCHRYITTKARLDYHLFKFHGIGTGKEKIFQCKSCPRSFSSKPGLRYHEWSSHSAGKSYTCEICYKVFQIRMLYNSHKLFAHGEKTIVCEMCGEMFFTVSKLNVHINAIHRNALSWLCKVCSAKFTTASAYRHHVNVKHKRVLYNCSHCSALFRKKYSLTQHLWKHGVFFCQRCDKKIDDAFTYVVHMAETHKIDVSSKINLKQNNTLDEDSSDNATRKSTTKGEVSSIVFNDIMINSNEFENSNLQSLTFEAASNKGGEDAKPDFVQLSPNHTINFDNVDSLEIQSVTNESMEMVEDVSLIDVRQILEDIDDPQGLKPLKSNTLPSAKLDALNISSSLQTDVSKSSPEIDESLQGNTELNDTPTLLDLTLNKIPVVNTLTSSVTLPPPKEPLSMVEPLVRSHMDPPDLVDLPVILEPVKSNTWSFPEVLGGQSGTSVDPVIHSLRDAIPDEDDPPVTREIDIKIPSEDEEQKLPTLPHPGADSVQKMDDQSLPTSAMGNDGIGSVHYKYVMYFDANMEKS